MEPIIESKRAAIADLCRRYEVRRLDVFGSAATGAFDSQRSDVDLLVEFQPDGNITALDAYFGLKESLEALFGRPVDLVVAAAVANPYLRSSIERTRRTLYAA